ncbi:MAG: mercury(II) reductase [Rhodothermia bacterium]|nr:MAG: mercury(II) reductase [Rhodothermia bacterium]
MEAEFDNNGVDREPSTDEENESSTQTYDLVIVGGGSAAFSAAIKTSELGGRAVIINDGLPIGGTCVNVGCIPSKVMIRAADAHHRTMNHGFDGIESESRISDFGAITLQTQALVEGLRKSKYTDVVAEDANISVVDERATIIDSHTVQAGRSIFTTNNILIATGTRTFVPPISGIGSVPYLTNETLYSLPELPDRLIVLGGGYVALENAQMLARLGSKVILLQRSARVLKTESEEITAALGAFLEEDGVEIKTGVDVEEVREVDGHIEIDVLISDERSTLEGSHVLLATGRTGNTENIGLEALGIETDERGFLTVDETLRTSVPNIFGAGDVIGEHQFVYTAAYEGSLAAENGPHSMQKERDYTALPWVIFTDPQLAGVGLDEQQAEAAGIDYEVTKLDLKHVPRALAARDTRGFIKLLRDTATDRLIGARILAPEGSELLMEVSLAIKYGITVDEIKSTFHPYLTLSEGIKLAAISFGKDIEKLSCCAA